MMPATAPGRTVLRRRVALAGRVSLAAGGTASAGTVRAEGAAAPAIETPIRADGCYFFLDLAPGDYRLAGHDDRGHEIEPRTVSITRVPATERPPMLEVALRVRGGQTTPGVRPAT